MIETVRPEERVNSLVRTDIGAHNQIAPFLPGVVRSFETFQNLYDDPNNLPPWRRTEGPVNSLIIFSG